MIRHRFSFLGFLASVCFAPEGDGGGQGAGGAAGGTPPGGQGTGVGAGQGAGGSGAGGAGGQAPAGGQQAAMGYRPDGLPDDLFGQSDKETIDRLFNQNKGFRADMSKRGEVPKDISGYEFKPSEKLAAHFAPDILDKDPLYRGVREDALAVGVTKQQFEAVFGKYLERGVDLGLVLPPFDPEKELAALVPAEMANLGADAKKAEVQKQVEANLAWLDKAGLPKEAVDFAKTHADYAGMHQLLGTLRGGNRERGFVQGEGGNGAGQQQELQARLDDPRNQFGGPKYDPAFAAETYKMQKAAIGMK